MQAMGDLFGVPVKVELEQSIQNHLPDNRSDCVADALARLVKVVVKCQIGPAVRFGDCVIDLDVNVAQFDDVRRMLLRVMHPVIRLRQPFASFRHQPGTVGVQPFPNPPQPSILVRPCQRLEDVCRRIPWGGSYAKGRRMQNYPPIMCRARQQGEICGVLCCKDNDLFTQHLMRRHERRDDGLTYACDSDNSFEFLDCPIQTWAMLSIAPPSLPMRCP